MTSFSLIKLIDLCLIILSMLSQPTLLNGPEEVIMKAAGILHGNSIRVTSNLIIETLSLTRFRCMSKCMVDDSCLTFGFNSDEQKCRLYGSSLTGNYSSNVDTGWKYYAMRHEYCPFSFSYDYSLDTCYLLTTGASTYTESFSICNGFRASLPIINSQAKQDWARSLFDIQTMGGFFLGSFVEAGNLFKWHTGENMSYTNWGQNQPDAPDKNESYVAIVAYDGYRWHDWSGTPGWTVGTVCEIRRQ